MNYSYKDSGNTGVRVISGLSSEVKPILNNTTDVEAEFYETDTRDEFEWDGANWVKTGSGGVDNVGNVASWSYGNWPNTWFTQGSAQIPSTAISGSVIYESPGDMSAYNTFTVENASPVDPITVQLSLNGINYSTDIAVSLADDVTGVKVLSIPTGKFAVVKDVRWKTVKVLKNGTTNEIPVIRFAYSVN